MYTSRLLHMVNQSRKHVFSNISRQCQFLVHKHILFFRKTWMSTSIMIFDVKLCAHFEKMAKKTKLCEKCRKNRGSGKCKYYQFFITIFGIFPFYKFDNKPYQQNLSKYWMILILMILFETSESDVFFDVRFQCFSMSRSSATLKAKKHFFSCGFCFVLQKKVRERI